MSDAAAASSSRPGSPEVVPTRRFGDLRGVQWRIDLGVLPSPPSASVDELRRVTADSRRRYATLRRRLLVDPHISKDGNSSSNLVIDNPLSQNPESSWGRFFRNAELEKMVDQDLLRLYPEDGSYFQTPGCQGMLRRILLLWCLRHPKCGYRQGMHELLAPLVYVLQVDINRLSQVRKLYEEHFTDKFDELSVHESDLTYNFDYKRFSNNMDSPKSSHGSIVKARSIDDLDPDVQKCILLSDAYGAEGELGIVLSEKFMEHDAYSMFEALMSGVNDSVAMADFFSHSPVDASNNSLPPVIEASSALYHLLSIVDSSLYSHLIELGVEPQYFALRWLRVLFGREFNLQDLLIIWDAIFMQDNCKISTGAEDSESSFGVFSSARGAFIAALAVSMMLYLRSSLLAAEISTSALQRLLNFPQNVDLKKLIGKAKSLQILALDATSGFMSSSPIGAFDQRKSKIVRAQSLSSDSVSPKSPLNLVPDSYWEERWRVLHKEEELKQGSSEKQVTSTKRKGWSQKVNVGLSRTESDPSPAKSRNQKKIPRSTVRRSLLEDLSRQLGSDEGTEEISGKEHSNDRDSTAIEDERCSGRDAGSDENSSVSSDSASPHCASIGLEVDSERSSDDHEDQFQPTTEDSPLPVSDIPEESSLRMVSDDAGSTRNVGTDGEQKPLMGKFQWLWKFGRSSPPESPSKRRGSIETPESTHSESCHPTEATIVDGSRNCETSVGCKGDAADLNVMGTLKNIGQSMLEHIQVIESAFQQDRGQVGSLESFSKNVLVGKGQVTAMAALKELRKISNLLSEM